ncbi:division/cell wall cluster transcriptional repressor MraZ [candidate division KSB1 bacterium]|nr:division/cell wall cluster transcriptional repressor MraZ [candidate division KSB1 bacterium]NIR71839.1 division/cell wall cluster transcriptional repressor MraZ [candidate division KSB1 bacterium]NIS25355.1 division/cell wall cluster transcriptional repressor MraZ [candidate division KSB1 bacterium]NIT71825.1 division/cell wall cluster transcriptional repressor MraZ [candidate division KSB1 bacterium]NIU25563.1 division/cell wall cluster transcriptional repressor MraZ [candidate division KS
MEDFLGTFDYSLDDKNRLSIPAKFRKVMSELQQKTFIISMLDDSRLTLYPYSSFRETIAKRISELPQFDENANELRRSLGLNTTDSSMDNQGRIIIPPNYCDYAGINKKVKIIGCTNKIELWNPEVYVDVSKVKDPTSTKEKLKQFSI